MGRRLLCGLVASAVLAMGCGNSLVEEVEVCTFQPPPKEYVLSEVDYGRFEDREECWHLPFDVPGLLDIPKADFITYTPSLKRLDTIRFNDYLTRSFVSERLHLDVDIGAVLIHEVLGVKPDVKEFGFFPSNMYETVCPSGSSGCQQQQRIAILRTSLEEQIDLIGTVFHEEGHTLRSPAESYDTFEDKALEEGKAYLTRLSGCLGIQLYNEEVMKKCVESTLGFTRSFLAEFGLVPLCDLEKNLRVKEEDAQRQKKSIYPYHKIGYAMVFALAGKYKGDLKDGFRILASADSHFLYDYLMNSSLTVREVIHLGAEAMDRYYGSEMYTNLFGKSINRSYVSNSYCDEMHSTLFENGDVGVNDDLLFEVRYPNFIRSKF